MQELATGWLKIYGTDTQKYFAAEMAHHPEWVNCRIRGRMLFYNRMVSVSWWTRAGRAIKSGILVGGERDAEFFY